MATIRTTSVFDNWYSKLRDRQAKARIAVRIDRLENGNPGQCRALTGDVNEMKVDVGPGYRVYYTDVPAKSSYCWSAATRTGKAPT